MTEIVYDIKKTYAGLDSWIAGLTEGTYNVEVDCSGVGADQFDGSSASSAAPFGEKLKKAKPGVKFNLKPINIAPEITNCSSLFYECRGLTSIDCSAFTQVNNASYMFSGCTGLTTITGTSAFTKVNNASYMFRFCEGLTTIDTSAFTQVNDASFMFYECRGLTSIDCSAFTQVNNATNMFLGCSGLTSIDCSAFTQVNNASGMFYNCTGLTTITGTSAFTQVKYAGYMFQNCEGLTTIDTSAFTQVNNASYMFSGCTGLTTITGTSAFTKVNNASQMFLGCSGLTSIDTSAFTQVNKASHMFGECTGLTTINWGNIKPTIVGNMFSGASAQKTIKVMDTETKNFIETNKSNMSLDDKYTIEVGIYLPNPIKYSDLSIWLPEYSLPSADLNITEIPKEAFGSELNNTLKSAQNVTSISLKMEAPTDLTSLANSFIDNAKLTKVDISNFTSVTDTSNCFKNCNNLAEINWGNIKPAINTSMFMGASKQKTIKVNSAEGYKFIKSNKEQMKLTNYTVIPDGKIVPPDQMEFEDFNFYKSFYEQGNHLLKFTDDVSLDPSKFIGTNLNASPLIETIKIEGVTFDFDLELPKNLTNLNYTFNNATHLNSLKINWGNNKPESHTGTFKNCAAQKTIIVGPFDVETKNWIESNKSVMNLDDKYTIEGGSDTVKYSNLGTLASLSEGTYTFKIDTADALADNFKGTSITSSDFNSKLKANNNVYYNIELDIPASDISYMLYNNKSVKSIKINSFNPVIKARTATAITADNAFNGCIFKEIDLNAFDKVSSANNMLDNNNNLEIIYDNSGDCLSKLTVNNPKLKTVYTTAAGREKARKGKFPDVKFYEKYERLSYAKNYGINPDDNHILGNLTVDGTINGTTIISDKLKESDSNGNSIYINGEIGQTMTFSVFDENDIKLPKLEENRKWKLIKEETYYEEI